MVSHKSATGVTRLAGLSAGILGFFALFSLGAALINGQSAADGCLFFLYQCCMLLTGLGTVLLLRIQGQSMVSLLSLGYVMGYCAHILLYFLLVPFTLGWMAPYAVAALAAAGLAVLILRRRELTVLPMDARGLALAVVLACVMLAIKLPAFNGMNLLPDTAGLNYYSQDLLYWISDAAALKIHFPPSELQLAGVTHYYHYFSSIKLAVTSLSTGISLARVGLIYLYLEPTLLLTFGGYLLMQKCLKNRLLTAAALIVLLLCAGWESVTCMNYSSHLYTAPFGFDTALALSMYCFYFVLLAREEGTVRMRLLVPAAVIFAVLTGTKSLTAGLLLGGVGILCLSWLIQKKIKLGLVYGIVFTAVLGMIFLLFLSPQMFNHHDSGIGREPVTLEWLGTLRWAPGISALYDRMTGWGIPAIIGQIAVVVIWIVASHPTIFLLYAFALICLAFVLRRADEVDITLLIMAVAAVILTLLVQQSGLSQMYFLLSSYPFIVLGTFRILARVFRERPSLVLSRLTTAMVLVLGVYGAIQMSVLLGPEIEQGREKLAHTNRTFYSREMQNNISASDFAAYEWVRLHTPVDSLLLSDRMLASEDSKRTFAAGAFCERQMYLEGYDYSLADEDLVRQRVDQLTDLFADPGTASADHTAFLQQEGVDYLLVTKWLHPDFALPDTVGQAVYETASIVVYQVR